MDVKLGRPLWGRNVGWGTRCCLLRVCLSVCLSVRPSAWNNSAPSGWIFVKFYIRKFYYNMRSILNICSNLTIRTMPTCNYVTFYNKSFSPWRTNRDRRNSWRPKHSKRTWSILNLLLRHGERLRGWEEREWTGSAIVCELLILVVPLLVRLFNITLYRKAAVNVLHTKMKVKTTANRYSSVKWHTQQPLPTDTAR